MLARYPVSLPCFSNVSCALTPALQLLALAPSGCGFCRPQPAIELFNFSLPADAFLGLRRQREMPQACYVLPCMPVISLGRSSDYAVNRHSVWVSDLFILFFRTKVETLNRLKKMADLFLFGFQNKNSRPEFPR